MSKQNRRTLALARRKKLLLDEIQQQRTQLAQEGQTWLEVTAPYDKAWNGDATGPQCRKFPLI